MCNVENVSCSKGCVENVVGLFGVGLWILIGSHVGNSYRKLHLRVLWCEVLEGYARIRSLVPVRLG